MADETAHDAAEPEKVSAEDAASAEALFKQFSELKEKGESALPETAEDDGGKAADPAPEQDGAATAAPEKTPPAEEKSKADVADDPNALKAALEAAKKQIDALEHENRSNRGRLSALERERRGTAAPEAAPAEPKADEAQADTDPLKSEKFASFKKEFPEIAGVLEDLYAPIRTEVAAVKGRTEAAEKNLSGLTEAQMQVHVVEQEAALAEKHQDWVAITRSPDFEAWLGEQPTEIQQLIVKNGERIVDAKAAIRGIDLYKSDRGIGREPAKPDPEPKAETPKVNGQGNGQGTTSPASDRRTRQLEAAAAVPDRGPGPASGPSGDDESALFRHFASMKDKEIAAGRL